MNPDNLLTCQNADHDILNDVLGVQGLKAPRLQGPLEEIPDLHEIRGSIPPGVPLGAGVLRVATKSAEKTFFERLAVARLGLEA